MKSMTAAEGKAEALRFINMLFHYHKVKRIGITNDYSTVIHGLDFRIARSAERAATLGWIVKHFQLSHEDLGVQYVERRAQW